MVTDDVIVSSQWDSRYSFAASAFVELQHGFLKRSGFTKLTKFSSSPAVRRIKKDFSLGMEEW